MYEDEKSFDNFLDAVLSFPTNAEYVRVVRQVPGNTNSYYYFCKGEFIVMREDEDIYHE